MYSWVTHTWNTVKGECPHGCTYCYMKRWGKQGPVKFDHNELKTDLGEGNTIFVGSSCDMFYQNIDLLWVNKTLYYTSQFPNNTYLFQSKNPSIMKWYKFTEQFPEKSLFATTIETNRIYKEMGAAPSSIHRAEQMAWISKKSPVYVTIEPIMDFDLEDLVELIKVCNPTQVNIGADSGNNNLPEPPKEKILSLIEELKKFTTIDQKRNLNRILNG